MPNNLLTLGYIGSVNVHLNINGHKVDINTHNAGLPYLSRIFAKLITGNYEDQHDLPEYIDLRSYHQDDTAHEHPNLCLSSQLPISGKTYEYNSEVKNWIAKFTASITHDNLISEISEDSQDLYRIYLYSGYDPDNLDGEYYHDIAYIDVQAKDLSKIIPGTQAIIEWSMQIVNTQ